MMEKVQKVSEFKRHTPLSELKE